MTTPVKERIKQEFDQAKVGGQQRAERISDILKDAATKTFEEIKDGSADLHVLTRKSLGDILEDLKDTPEAEQFAAEQTEVADAPQAAPTWREILTNAMTIVRDRRGDWLQQFRNFLREDAIKFDNDMTKEHGDRYLRFKQLVKQASAWVATKAQSTQKATDETAVHPVSIEVMDDDDDAKA